MIRLAQLRDEALLVHYERRDGLEAARRRLATGDKKAPFTQEEIAKRWSRLPNLHAISRGLTAMEARRAEVPEWLLTAFEGASEP